MRVYSRLLAVNYLGCVELTRHLLPPMISRGSGHVVVVSSVQGLLPIPGRAAYCGRLDDWLVCPRNDPLLPPQQTRPPGLGGLSEGGAV